MKTSNTIFAVVAVAVVAIGAIYFVEIDQTQETELPNVDVSVEGGQAPEFNVDTGSVDIGSEKTTVTVPKVELTEKEVEVPTLKVQPAE